MKALRIVLIVLLGLFLVPGVLRLVGLGIALAKDFSSGAQNASYLLGAFVGTMLMCALIVWLMKYLWRKNRVEEKR